MITPKPSASPAKALSAIVSLYAREHLEPNLFDVMADASEEMTAAWQALTEAHAEQLRRDGHYDEDQVLLEASAREYAAFAFGFALGQRMAGGAR